MGTFLCNCLNSLLSDGIISSLRVYKVFWLAWLKIANASVVSAFTDISIAWLTGSLRLVLTKMFHICSIRSTDVFRIDFWCFWSFTSWDFAWDETWVKISRFILGMSRKLPFSCVFAFLYVFLIWPETMLVLKLY